MKKILKNGIGNKLLKNLTQSSAFLFLMYNFIFNKLTNFILKKHDFFLVNYNFFIINL